jgi:nitroimidazol reductase NimA-like FMN-containing flavoprotein (pyridoxamine 5'-phosphate oxidase superfamily)
MTALDPEALAYLEAHRIAHLATADARGRPRCVPVCFACDSAVIYSALVRKPKRLAAQRLRRVRNIQANPRMAVLVDTTRSASRG